MIYLPKDIIELLQNIVLDIYTRRSSNDKEDKQMRSIPGQINDIQGQLVDRYDIKIGKIFKESQSAFKPGRPEFGEMLTRIHDGVSQGVISWHPNRDARNYKDGGDFVQLMSDGKLKILLTCHGYFLNTPRDKEYLMNEFTRATRDSDDKSEAVKRGYRDKISRGYIPSGRLPEGYKHIKDKKSDEMINAPDRKRFDKQKKAIYKIIYEGFTPPEALDYLNNDLEYITKRTKRMGGNPMAKSTWYRRLSNPILIGKLTNWTQDHHDENTDYEAAFESMLTDEEFDVLQIKLGKKGYRRKNKRNWPYNGIMECGTCGSAVLMDEHWQMRCSECKKKFALTKDRTECPHCNYPIDKMKSQPIHYVHVKCGKTKKLSDGRRCPESVVSLTEFEKNIDKLLGQFEIPVEFKDWAIKWLKIIHKQDSTEHLKRLKNVNKKDLEIDKQLRNLILMRAGNEIDSKELKQMKKTLKEDKKKLNQVRGKLQKQTDDWVDQLEKVFDFATHARYWFANGDIDDKRTILLALGSNLVLQNKKARIKGLNPFLILGEMKSTLDYKEIIFELSENPLTSVENTTSISAFPNLLGSMDSNHDKQLQRLLSYH